MRVAPTIMITAEQRSVLQRLARARSAQPARLVQRAKVILLAADGLQNQEIAQHIGASRYLVARWRNRFCQSGISGIEKDAPRPGRKRIIGEAKVCKIVSMTTSELPKDATQWSRRSLAAVAGVSPASIGRIWKRHGLKPHLLRTFKLSNDPQFSDKLTDIVGLYLHPPEHALVLCADEKSQIQALDRTQRGLPLKSGHTASMTHDYRRHGTTTLFAALNVLDGTVISTCMQRHRHEEWLKFLRLIDKQVPQELDIHLIVDNYATHKHPRVQRWLARHKRFHMHFTPTSASWLNMVERFFRDITTKRIRRGTFTSVSELATAITKYIDQHNANPKPFIWTATASDILEKVKRAHAAFDKLQSA